MRGDAGTLGHCREFGPHHVFGDPTHPGRGIETAIGASHHALRVTDGPRDVFQPVSDNLRVLNKASQIVDHAGRDDLVVGDRKFLQDAIFVLMPGIGEGQHEPADIGMLEEFQSHHCVEVSGVGLPLWATGSSKAAGWSGCVSIG
jgi:hypothetical protein